MVSNETKLHLHASFERLNEWIGLNTVETYFKPFVKGPVHVTGSWWCSGGHAQKVSSLILDEIILNIFFQNLLDMGLKITSRHGDFLLKAKPPEIIFFNKFYAHLCRTRQLGMNQKCIFSFFFT